MEKPSDGSCLTVFDYTPVCLPDLSFHFNLYVSYLNLLSVLRALLTLIPFSDCHECLFSLPVDHLLYISYFLDVFPSIIPFIKPVCFVPFSSPIYFSFLYFSTSIVFVSLSISVNRKNPFENMNSDDERDTGDEGNETVLHCSINDFIIS